MTAAVVMELIISGGTGLIDRARLANRRRSPWNTPIRAFGVVVAMSVLSAHRPAAAEGISADFEVGVVSASRNDVRIPGAGGADLSLVDDLSAPPTPVFRLRVGYRFAERHLITALYAPLRLNAIGVLDREAAFAGTIYPAGDSVLGVYRFDSYRLTYRYSFVRNETVELAAGVTGKIRDAEISLYGSRTARKTNTGFVPLLTCTSSGARRAACSVSCSTPTRSPRLKDEPRTSCSPRPGLRAMR